MSSPKFPEVSPGEVVLFKRHPHETAWLGFQVESTGQNGEIHGVPVGYRKRANDDVFNGVLHTEDDRLKDAMFVRSYYDDDKEGQEWKGVWTVHPDRLRREADTRRLYERLEKLEAQVVKLSGKREKQEAT